MEKLRVGYVGVSIPSYFADEWKQGERAIAGLGALAEELDFDLYPIRKTIMDADGAEMARRELEANKIDFLMLENAGCSQGQQLIPLSKACGRLGLWATPEPREDSPDMQLHSFVSMSMYASIMKTYLGWYDIPYKWFYGQTDEDQFQRRFRVTIQALSTIKKLSQTRIGWIGGLSPGFYDMIFDERKLEHRFGVRVFPHELTEIVELAKRYDEARVGSVTNSMKAAATATEVADIAMDRGSRTYLALKDMAEREGYQALAVESWPKFQEFYGIAPCVAYSWLGSEDGMAVACEGDVLGSLSMLMLNCLTNTKGSSTLLDIAHLDPRDSSLLLWHCGVTPRHFANAKGIKWVNHSTIGRKAPGEPRFGVAGDQVFGAQETTVSYIGRDGDTLLVMNSEIIEKPEQPGFGATRGWFNQFRLNQEPIEIWDLVNSLSVHGQEHHYAVAQGDVSGPLLEMAAWLKMDLVKKVPYKDYLQIEGVNV